MTPPDPNATTDPSADDVDQARACLIEDVLEARSQGEPIDVVALAGQYGLDVADVERALLFVDALRDALAPDADEQEPPLELPPPVLPPDYEVLEEIGRGGMGVVYRAQQKSLGRVVAVKVLRPGELTFGQALARFQREARSLARLRHRHIVTIHEVGECAGAVYYTMDYIEGASLAELIRRGEVTPERAVRLLRQVASAIAYTHGHGLIHRDLKPANVLVGTDGDALVADFGLAREVAAVGELTTAGQPLGTPAYMSPEQARGDSARVGAASDIYALGAILYECLTGRPPFASRSLVELLHAVVHDEPVPPRKLRPTVQRDLEAICLKGLAKTPERRYVTARALLEDLERFEAGRPVLAKLPGPAERIWRGVRRQRWALAWTAAALLIVGSLYPLVMVPALREAPADMVRAADALLERGDAHGALTLYRQVMLSGNLSLAERLAHSEPLARGKLAEAQSLFAQGRLEEAADALDFSNEPFGAWIPAELSTETLYAIASLEARCGAHERSILTWDVINDPTRRTAPEQTSEGVAAASAAFSRLGFVLGDRPPRSAVVPWRIGRALLDPAHPNHDEVVPIFAAILLQGEHDARRGALAWLSWNAQATPGGSEALLHGILPAFVESVGGDGGALWADLRAVITELSMHFGAGSMGTALATLASEDSQPPSTRAAAASLLALTTDLPWPMAADGPLEPTQADEVLQLWEQSLAPTPPEHLRLRLGWAVEAALADERAAPSAVARRSCSDWLRSWIADHAGLPDIAPAAGDSGDEDWRARLRSWWDENSTQDPRDGLAAALGRQAPRTEDELRELLAEFVGALGRRRIWLHHLLAASAGPEVAAPAWNTLEEEPAALAQAWCTALDFLPQPSFTLRVAEFPWKADGDIRPPLWEQVTQSAGGAPVHIEGRSKLTSSRLFNVRRVSISLPGLQSSNISLAPSEKLHRANATMHWQRGGRVLAVEHSLSRLEEGRSSSESQPTRLASLGMVMVVAGEEAGHAAPAYALAEERSLLLAIAEPAGSSTASAPWGWSDWQHRFLDDLRRLAEAVAQAGDAEMCRSVLEAHRSQLHLQLPRLALAFASASDIRAAAPHLETIAAAARQTGWQAEPLLVARLLAGDSSLCEEPDWEQRSLLSVSDFLPSNSSRWVACWAVIATRAADDRIVTLALDQLDQEDLFFYESALSPLAAAIRDGRLDAPPDLAQRIVEAASMDITHPDLLNDDLLGSAALVATLSAVAGVSLWILVARRRRHTARLVAGATLVTIGMLATMIEIAFEVGDGTMYNLLHDLTGMVLSAVGAAVLATAASGGWRRWVTPAALGGAGIVEAISSIDLLGRALVIVALLGLPSLAGGLDAAAGAARRRWPERAGRVLRVSYAALAIMAASNAVASSTLGSEWVQGVLRNLWVGIAMTGVAAALLSLLGVLTWLFLAARVRGHSLAP